MNKLVQFLTITALFFSASAVTTESHWKNYFDVRIKQERPWRTVEIAAENFAQEEREVRVALDLGCGVGIDSLFLLQNGFSVIALDAEEIAGEYLLRKVPNEFHDHITFVHSTYEEYSFPQVDLVNAGYSLPFCPKEDFADVMKKITDCILPGGRFSGHFFGTSDSWKKLALCTEEEVKKFFEEFEIEFFESKEWEGMSGTGPKHWHVIEVVAKKNQYEEDQSPR